jgi:hypothetical protein
MKSDVEIKKAAIWLLFLFHIEPFSMAKATSTQVFIGR